MARVFTTEFQYNGATYTALITQIDGSISISIPDTKLHSLIPNGKAVFTKDKGLELSSPQLTEAQSLMVSILAAIESRSTFQNNPSAMKQRKEAE